MPVRSFIFAVPDSLNARLHQFQIDAVQRFRRGAAAMNGVQNLRRSGVIAADVRFACGQGAHIRIAECAQHRQFFAVVRKTARLRTGGSQIAAGGAAAVLRLIKWAVVIVIVPAELMPPVAVDCSVLAFALLQQAGITVSLGCI